MKNSSDRIRKLENEIKDWKFLLGESKRTQQILLKQRSLLVKHIDNIQTQLIHLRSSIDKIESKQKSLLDDIFPFQCKEPGGDVLEERD